MKNELSEIFRQGDAELHSTAGEDAVLVRRMPAERVPVSVVISAAEVAYTLTRATGPVVTCDRVGHIQKGESMLAPKIGDVLEAGGEVYEILRVTGWAFDTSWHVDLAVRKGRK